MNTLKALLLATSLAAGSSKPDGWITTKSKLTLMTKGELKSSQVHVDTNEGVVTLYGKVKDAAQRKAAENAVRQIAGVAGVKNLLQIVPSAQEKTVARSDADIKDQVEKMLREDPALKDSKLAVKSVDKGVVLITGEAKTLSDRLRAVADVDQIAGVKRVVTEVEGPDEYGDDERNLSGGKSSRLEQRNSLTDTRITADVKMKLLGAKGVPSTDINVDTRDGIVTLFGAVPNETAKSRAEIEAAEVGGVTRVKNQLEIVPKNAEKGIAARDSEIADELKKRYATDDAFKDLSLDVKNGSVRLTGTVRNAWEKLHAMRIARSAKGVKELHEEIEIERREGRQF